MPVTVLIHPSRRLVYMRLAAAVSRQEILEQRRQVVQLAAFDPTFDLIVDLRAADLSGLSSPDIAALASSSSLRPSVRRVMVADHDAAVGVSRMFAGWAGVSRTGGDLTIVPTLEEALRFLGHPYFDPAVAERAE